MLSLEVPDELRARFARFGVFILDELGFGILWDEGLAALVGEDEDGIDLSGTRLNEAARQNLSDWALREMAKGSPKKSAHSSASYWSAVEALVEDVFVIQVQRNPAYLDGELGKTRLSISDFQLLEEDDLLRLVAAQAPGIRGRTAPAAFESLLNFVDLSGPVGERVGRDLRELQQVRNVIVHRNGIADRRLAEVAWAVDVEVGKDIEVTADDALRYYRTCVAYGETLQRRVQARYAGEAYPPDAVDREVLPGESEKVDATPFGDRDGSS
jgi:hypothetical protein